ncbi:MAG TPA: DUF4097 family beta strand repeat-containing protein [Dehalococcoidia bacterium]|nr:DUF4097 family beta strand repeat-containing protein [Dehalococcoidia bacterium]
MEHVRTVTRRFETGERAVLHVESRSGSVVVEAHTSPVVVIDATVRIWSNEPRDLDDAVALVEEAIEQDAHRIVVRAPALPRSEHWSWFGGRRGSSVDYVVRVPLQCAVRVLARSGSVRVTGIEGRVHIESGSGRVSLEDITGNVTLTSRSGGVAIERVRGDVSAETRSGRLEVRGVRGSAELQARSGSIEARDVGGNLRAQTHTGSIIITDAGAGVKAQAHTGTIRFSGRVQGDCELRAHTGSIWMAVDAAHPFFIDAESEIGSVRSELPPRRGGAPPPAGGPKVRLRTRTGSIRLTRL